MENYLTLMESSRAKLNYLLFLGLVWFLFSCNENKKQESDALPFYNTPEFNAEWIEHNDARYAKIHTIDTFSLQNQQGHLITKDSLDGHIYVANFFFTTCPTICPKMVNNFHILQDKFADNPQLKLVSYSVTPWIDSVAQLKKYGVEHHVNPSQWYLLTGNKEEIYTLARKSYFAEKGLGLKKNTDDFLHTEAMLLIDKKARIRGIYNATQVADIERIAEDVQTLLKEQ